MGSESGPMKKYFHFKRINCISNLSFYNEGGIVMNIRQ